MSGGGDELSWPARRGLPNASITTYTYSCCEVPRVTEGDEAEISPVLRARHAAARRRSTVRTVVEHGSDRPVAGRQRGDRNRQRLVTVERRAERRPKTNELGIRGCDGRGR